jgi:hypothetical protein
VNQRRIDREVLMLLARHETIEKLEIIDEHGVPVGSVTRPSDPRLFGTEKGTVYLDRALPHLPESVRPAHAA